MGFSALSSSAARALASRDFGRRLAGVGASPAASVAAVGRVERYVNDYTALVVTHAGKRLLERSTVPLRTPAGPVDLRVASTASAFVPRRSPARLSISRMARGGVTVGAGIRFTFEGADAAGTPIGRNTVAFPSVAEDADASVTPTATGVDLSTILRSRLSPQQLRYRVQLPAGTVLKASGRGAGVYRGSRQLLSIKPPAATDAQGSPVPVTMAVQNSQLVLRIKHRSLDVAYPILVDPDVQVPMDPTYWVSFDNPGGTGYFQFPGPAEITAPSMLYTTQDWGVWQWTTIAPATQFHGGDPYVTRIEFDDVSFATTNPSLQAWIGPILGEDCNNYWGPNPPTSYVTSGPAANCGGGAEVAMTVEPNTLGSASLQVGSILVTEDVPSLGSSDPTAEMLGGTNPAEPNRTMACAGHPVECSTGNFFENQTDLALRGHGLPFAVTRTYNALAASAGASGPFGYGWSSAYRDHLAIDPDANTITVMQSNGSQVPYSTWTGVPVPAHPWIEATLAQNSDGTYTYTLPNHEVEQFDANGQLTKESDRYGNSLTCSYDPAGNLSTVTDDAGRTITFTYADDGSGHVSSVSGPMGSVSYGYDPAGDLTRVTQLDGNTWTFGYDANHLMTSETDPAGHTTTNGYDDQSRVVSQTDGENRTRTWGYPAPGHTVITNPAGDVADEQFNSEGEPTAITRGYGTSAASTELFAYDNELELTGTTDADAHSWSYGYNSNGDRIRATDPLGNTTRWTYDDSHDMTSETDPKGHTTTYGYQDGELTSVSRPVTETGEEQTTTYGYDPAGDLTSLTDPNHHQWRYGYDDAGNVTSMIAPDGSTSTWAYDGSGYRTSTVSARGNALGANPVQFTTTYTTDAFGHPIATTDPLGHVTSVQYNGDGQPISSTDANDRSTTYSYDRAGQLQTITRADGTTVTCHNDDGLINAETDGAGKQTTYAYDPRGDLTSTTDPLNRTTTYEYDLAGNMTYLIDPAGRTTTYGYDADNQPVSISHSDGVTPDVSFGYDVDGQRTVMSDGTGDTTYSYDSLGRLSSETNGSGQQVSYGYDLAGNETSITYPNGKTVTHAVDPNGRLFRVTDWLGNTTTFDYDLDSDLQTTTYPSSTGNVDNYTYNDADQLTATTMQQGATALATLSYTRDPDGQVQAVTPTGLGQTSETYTYGKLNQLASVNTTTYGYDNADNLTALPSGQTFAYDAANQITSTSVAGQTPSYTYDQLGERTQGTVPTVATFAYSYDQAQDLTKATPTAFGAPIAGGDSHSIALGASGRVYAWGANATGQLGNGTTTSSPVPVQTTSLTNISAVAAGASHSLALKADGTVWSWGNNNDGQLGNGTTTNASTPGLVPSLSGIAAIAAAPGGYHSLALKPNGTVWAWGLNANGQLGNNTVTNSKTPVQVANITTATAVAAGANHSLAIKAGGTVADWGDNSCGQLGNNTTTGSKTPVQVSNITGVIAIAGGGCHSVALKSDGTVWAWGSNKYGQLGNNSTTNSKIPVQARNLTSVIAIAAGANDTLALKKDGTVWAWGLNSSGQLGTGNTTNSSIPVQVKNLAGVVALASGANHSLFSNNTGNPDAVGQNTSAQLGNNSTTNASTIVAVSNLDGVRSLAATTATYDGDGRRATSTAAGVTQQYAWDDTSQLALLLTDATNNYIYGPDGLPIEHITTNGTPVFYHHDQLGSTRMLTTSGGNVAATYTYDPYGNLTSQSGTIDTPLRWAGQYEDAQTGLQYDRARYYDPQTGQFISRDRLDALTHQPYSYAGDNPVDATDPSGLDSTVVCPEGICPPGAPPVPGGTSGGVGGALVNAGHDVINTEGQFWGQTVPCFLFGDGCSGAAPSAASAVNFGCPGEFQNPFGPIVRAAIPPGSMPPPAALRDLARRTGLDRGDLSDAFHRIKRAGLLGPADSTRIDSEGNVYDTETGEPLGNVLDEAHG